MAGGLFGTSFEDPKTMAVLSLAGGLMSGGNSGQALQKGLLGYQQVMQAANDRTRQAAMDKMAQDEFAMKQREFGMREDVFKAQQQAVDDRKKHLQVLRGALASGDVTGNELLQLGLPADIIKDALSVRDMGRPEVARTVEVEGPNGQKLIRSVDKFGRDVGPAYEGYTAPVSLNLGDRTVIVKPQAGQQFALGMSPDARASNAVAWANYGLSKQKMEQEKEPKLSFNAEAGGFIVPPSAKTPSGGVIPLAGFQKPLTEGQSKSLLFGSRMQAADKVMAELEAAGKVVSTPLSQAPFVGGLVNALNTEKGQMLDQAKRDFLTAALRRESGAVIGDNEFDSANIQYFPQIGDSEAVIRQKAKNRDLAIRGILADVPKNSPSLNAPSPAAGFKILSVE